MFRDPELAPFDSHRRKARRPADDEICRTGWATEEAHFFPPETPGSLLVTIALF